MEPKGLRKWLAIGAPSESLIRSLVLTMGQGGVMYITNGCLKMKTVLSLCIAGDEQTC
jgi:hypothetical protein